MNTNWTTTDFYKQERLLLRVYNIVGNTLTLNTLVIDGVSYSSFSATHVPTNGEVNIDVSEFARMAQSQFSFKITDSSTNKTLTGNYAGNTNPADYLAPTSPMFQKIAPFLHDTSLQMFLPSMIIGGTQRVQCEYILQEGQDTIGAHEGVYSTLTFGLVALESGVSEFIYDINQEMKFVQRLAPQECGVRYFFVGWRSRTGKMKRHFWEVVKVTESVSKSQELLTLSNEYNVRKDKLVSLTLRLRNLDAYDFWYYSDIINSEEVIVRSDNGQVHRAECTTKKSVTPDGDGGKMNTLEVELNYIRYEGI